MGPHLCEECAFREDCGIRDRLLDLEDDTGVKARVSYCPEYRGADDLDPTDPDTYDVLDRSTEPA